MIRSKDYKDFLTKATVYKRAQALWKQLFDNYLNEYEEWVVNRYANGKEIRDGNPINSALSGNIAIRIIQLDYKIDNPLFVAWTDKRNFNDLEITEFVIALQLYHHTYQTAEELIESFVSEKLTKSRLNVTNKRYQDIWNKRKYNYLIKFTTREKPIRIIFSFSESDLKKGKIDIRGLRKYEELVRSGILTNTKFRNHSLNREFVRLRNEISHLGEVISINHTFPVSKVSNKNKKKYIKAIERNYNGVTNFVSEVKRSKISAQAYIKGFSSVKEDQVF